MHASLKPEDNKERRPAADKNTDHDDHMSKKVKITATQMSRLNDGSRRSIEIGQWNVCRTRGRTNTNENENVIDQKDRCWNDDDQQ